MTCVWDSRLQCYPLVDNMPWAESVCNLALKVKILSLCSRGRGGVATSALLPPIKDMWVLWHSCSGAALSPGAKCSVFGIRLTARETDTETQREVRKLPFLTLLVFQWGYLCALILFFFFFLWGFIWRLWQFKFLCGWLTSCVYGFPHVCIWMRKRVRKVLDVRMQFEGWRTPLLYARPWGIPPPFLSSSSSLLQPP